MTPSRFLPLCLLALLTACSLAPPRQQQSTTYYDLPAFKAESTAALRSLDVVPGSWLAGTAMHYRLAYADGNRREHYAGSRWSGQPAELLGVRLQRSLMSDHRGVGAGCRASCLIIVAFCDSVELIYIVSPSAALAVAR